MANQTTNSVLPQGHQLQNYTIFKKISVGGFSIVYLAYSKNNNPVVIKEFMPNSLHLRTSGTQVSFKNKEEEVKFFHHIKGFHKEIEVVSRIQDRSVVNILDSFLDNGTAYMVMQYEYGRTLQRVIQKEWNSLDEQKIQKIFVDILKGIKLFHDNKILHLDLKPGNIWIRTDDSALILDLGTARLYKTSESKNSPMAHTPGFAALEQHKPYYSYDKVGPWTDIYGIGATLFACIEGVPPVAANIRKEKEDEDDFEKKWAGMYSIKILQLVKSMMNLDYTKRPQEIAQILNSLEGHFPYLYKDSMGNLLKKLY